MASESAVELNGDTNARGHARESAPTTAPPAAPAAVRRVPFWAVMLTGASAGIFTLGLLRALTIAPTDTLQLSFTAREAVLYTLVAVVGRVVSVAIQSEVVAGLMGASGRLRAVRRTVLVGSVRAQVPLAVRDIALGVLGLTGAMSTSTLVGLSLSPLDPFLVVSVVVFHRSVRGMDTADPRRDVVRSVVAFTAFLYVIKLALFALGVAQ